MDIHPQLLTLHKLLSGRLFRIPQYQRAYSWTRKERLELFDDIRKAHAKRGTHFMATIVGLHREDRLIGSDEFHVLDVVDGQQRLTTLVLLLKAIELAAGDSDAEKGIRAELRALLVKSDELAPVLLQTNHDSSQHCLTYLRDGAHVPWKEGGTFANRELLRAMDDCERFVKRWTVTGKSLIDLLAMLKNRTQFILHEVGDESLVYSVFEVLNSRGLAVSWFDRLKSILMGIAFEASTGNVSETIDELHRIWKDVYSCVGTRQGLSVEALKFAATLRTPLQPGRPLGEEKSVEVLRNAAAGTAKGAVEVSTWVLHVTKAVAKLRADRRRGGVTDIVQARLLAVAILLRDDLTDGDRDDLLSAWERVSFRVYGMFGNSAREGTSTDARTKVGDYVRLARQCYTKKLGAEVLRDRIFAIGAAFPIGKAVDGLRNIDCYNGWEEEARYFLFRYETHLAKKNGQKFDNEQWGRIWRDSAAKSIDHIYPQSEGVCEPSETDVFVHRLGNLLLLPPGLNSALGAKAPESKRSEYLKTGLAIAVDVAGRIPPWDRVAIEAREEELLTWAKQEWAD